MVADGSIISRPGDDDPDAIKLMRRLSIVSRRRWPKEGADPAPLVGVPPPKKKKTPPTETVTPDPEAKAADPPSADEGIEPVDPPPDPQVAPT
jgi:coenzyme F420 hydrogenase subunit beta